MCVTSRPLCRSVGRSVGRMPRHPSFPSEPKSERKICACAAVRPRYFFCATVAPSSVHSVGAAWQSREWPRHERGIFSPSASVSFVGDSGRRKLNYRPPEIMASTLRSPCMEELGIVEHVALRFFNFSPLGREDHFLIGVFQPRPISQRKIRRAKIFLATPSGVA